MTRIHLGLTLPNGPAPHISRETYLQTQQEGLQLITEHFDSAWLTDHLQYGESNFLEGWTNLTYLAALYPQLHFGHAVLCQSFRNPALLAKMVASLQYLTGGRFIFGVGAGWKEDEYAAYGYPFPSAGTRVEELEETLQIVKSLWRDKQATFQGKHYQIADAYCEPKPEPAPPIMIGGSKPRMLRVIARHADWWNVSWTGIEQYRLEAQECERACAEVGRDPATLRRTWFGPCVCASTETEVRQLNTRSITPDQGFVGTPSQIIEQMQPFIDLGVDYFMLGWGGFPSLSTPELLVREVLPALHREHKDRERFS